MDTSARMVVIARSQISQGSVVTYLRRDGDFRWIQRVFYWISTGEKIVKIDQLFTELLVKDCFDFL